ncbi:hypothetical protein M3Y97_00508500 [Aphelenchoides bicaudatus]|nr:hypothetical protein M3Y97_00508500 [Aphelenchoides bicaudatus]
MTERELKNYAEPTIIRRNVPKDPSKARGVSSGPNKRSGHRVFVNDDYLYVVGGFNSGIAVGTGSSTFKDVWKLNLLTNQWSMLKLIGHFDDTMASFSLVFVPEFDRFYVYGGTGFPFAENVSASLYECQIVDDETCRINKLEITGEEPPRLYGQSMVYQLNYKNEISLYVIGGTQGFVYQTDVYEFHIDKSNKVECRKLGDSANEEGRYRHESFIYKNEIYSIGGANDQTYIPMETITVFDLNEKKYYLKVTLPNDREQFPEVRKGHSLVRYGSKIFIFGGLHFPNEENNPENILKDIWMLDLEEFRWTKLKTELPQKVFFHSADISSIGQICSYGGCVSAQPEPVRTKNVTTFFIDAPTLSYMTLERFYKQHAEILNRTGETYTFSMPLELLKHTLKPRSGHQVAEAFQVTNDNSAA